MRSNMRKPHTRTRSTNTNAMRHQIDSAPVVWMGLAPVVGFSVALSHTVTGELENKSYCSDTEGSPAHGRHSTALFFEYIFEFVIREMHTIFTVTHQCFTPVCLLFTSRTWKWGTITKWYTNERNENGKLKIPNSKFGKNGTTIRWTNESVAELSNEICFAHTKAQNCAGDSCVYSLRVVADVVGASSFSLLTFFFLLLFSVNFFSFRATCVPPMRIRSRLNTDYYVRPYEIVTLAQRCARSGGFIEDSFGNARCGFHTKRQHAIVAPLAVSHTLLRSSFPFYFCSVLVCTTFACHIEFDVGAPPLPIMLGVQFAGKAAANVASLTAGGVSMPTASHAQLL